MENIKYKKPDHVLSSVSASGRKYVAKKCQFAAIEVQYKCRSFKQNILVIPEISFWNDQDIHMECQ